MLVAASEGSWSRERPRTNTGRRGISRGCRGQEIHTRRSERNLTCKDRGGTAGTVASRSCSTQYMVDSTLSSTGMRVGALADTLWRNKERRGTRSTSWKRCREMYWYRYWVRHTPCAFHPNRRCIVHYHQGYKEFLPKWARQSRARRDLEPLDLG
jgi:hypothetical protein